MKTSGVCLWWLACFSASWISVFGQVNSWTNVVGGLWEDPSWSLGRLPEAATGTMLTNGPGKTVTVAASTVVQFPNSLDLSALEVSAPDTQTNILVLTHGSEVPFLTTQLSLGSHGVVSNAGSLLSALEVSISPFAMLDQNGGVTQIRDALGVQGVFAHRSGVVEAPHASAVVSSEGRISQIGGVATYGDLRLRSWTSNAAGPPAYQLADGWLFTTNLASGGGNSPTRFIQDGGTNASTVVRLEGYFSEAEYLLNSGALLAGSATILGSDYNHAELRVSDGLLVVTNDVTLFGGLRHGATLYPGFLRVLGGECSLGNLEVGPYSFYAQSNGTVHVAGSIRFSASNIFARTTATLAGGVLAAKELTFGGAGVNLQQTGGTLVLSNRFVFGGRLENPPLGLAVYSLSGGSVAAPVIELFSELRVEGPGTSSQRILNNELFSLAGVLKLSGGNESLGRFRLLSDSTIHLGNAGSNTVRFDASGGESWSSNAVLYVLNWTEENQLVFGTNSAGLNAVQLAQLRFIDAPGLPGTNYARLLGAGEVVPALVPPLLITRLPQDLVLTWSGGFILEEAANPQGPYELVPSGESPFRVNPDQHRERYFRLARPAP